MENFNYVSSTPGFFFYFINKDVISNTEVPFLESSLIKFDLKDKFLLHFKTQIANDKIPIISSKEIDEFKNNNK